MMKNAFNFFSSLILCFLMFCTFVIGAKKIAPLNEEEWIAEKRKFIVRVDNNVIFLNSLQDEVERNDRKSSEIYSGGSEKGFSENNVIFRKSAEIKKFFSFVEVVKRPLPPKLVLKIFNYELQILGWGHTGPVSSIMFEVSGKLRDLFGNFGLHILGLRILNFIILFLFAFFFAIKVRKISAAPFILSFTINFLFIHAGMLYYLVMSILTFLCFEMIQKKKFLIFNLLSVLLCLTHMRGFVISISLILSFFIVSLIDLVVRKGYVTKAENNIKGEEENNDDEQRLQKKEIKNFIKALFYFSPLYLFCFFVYVLPSFIDGRIYEGESFEGFQILSYFFFEFISKLPFLPQLVATRTMDFILSGNLYYILKELGITLNWKYFPFFSSIFNLFFFVPALISIKREDKLFLTFLVVYFVLSIIAVPFFFGMPWQFIPLCYIILLKSFKELNKIKLKGVVISDYLSYVFCSLSVVIFFNVFSNSEKFFKPFLLYSEHKKVMDTVDVIKKQIGSEDHKDINILCITKSDIFYISFDCDLAGKYILSGGEEEFKRRMIRISQILDFYDVLILSYHFFDLYDIVKKENFYPVLKNDAFLVLIKKDFLFSGSSEQQK